MLRRPPALALRPNSLKLSLSPFPLLRFPEKRPSLFSLPRFRAETSLLFRPSVGIITDFRLLPEPSLPPASSLIFLARVGRTLLRRVSRKSDDTSNTRSRRSWRELTRLPIPSLSLSFLRISIEQEKFVISWGGGREGEGLRGENRAIDQV